MIRDCKLDKNVKIPFPHLVNLYQCEVGENSFIGPFVEIQKGVIIGKRCRIQSHSFVCTNVTIGDDVFIGHGVMFINDKFPKAGRYYDADKTIIGNKVSIGSNSTILPVTIGEGTLIGAGSVVTKDFGSNLIVKGNPAKLVKR